MFIPVVFRVPGIVDPIRLVFLRHDTFLIGTLRSEGPEVHVQMRSGASGFTGIVFRRCLLLVCARCARGANRASLDHRHPFDDDNVGASLQMGVGVLEAGAVGRIRAGADGHVISEALLCANSPVVHHLDHLTSVHGFDGGTDYTFEVNAFVSGALRIVVSRGRIVESIVNDNRLRHGPTQTSVVGGVGPNVIIGPGVNTQAVAGAGNFSGHGGSPCRGPDSVVRI